MSIIYRQAQDIIGELADSRTVSNQTLLVAGAIAFVSLIVTILLGLFFNSWQPMALGVASVVFLITIAPLWGILSAPRSDVVTINAPFRRQDLFDYSEKKHLDELKGKKKREKWGWYTSKARLVFFAGKISRNVALGMILLAWLLSVVVLIIVQVRAASQNALVFFSFLSVSILAFLLLADRAGEGYSLSNRLTNIDASSLLPLFSHGICLFPKKLRVKDSRTVVTALKHRRDFERKLERFWEANATHARRGKLHVEAELHAAGVKVEGDRSVKLSHSSQTAEVMWSCCFPNAGIQEIDLTLSVVNPPGAKILLFTHRQEVKVENLLMASWQPVLTVLVSILTAYLAIFKGSLTWPF